ncbi:MAG: hypothetical protein WBO23_14260 [Burkholderiales bacterium]
MHFGNLLKRILQIFTWGIGGLGILCVIWFAANRLFDARPDPRRDAFLKLADSEVPDEKNMAVGIAGLSAPRGADVMKHGAEIKKLYERNAPWPEIQRKAHSPDELKLTVESEQINCWMDPDWPGMKGCLPFERSPQVLADNRELLGRYKALYKLNPPVNLGLPSKNLIPLTKLAVAEIRLDMKNGNYEAAYAKWRDQFRFTKTYLRGQEDWVGKAIGLVNFGMSFPVIEDLLVRQPSLARGHFQELLELLRPEGIELINPIGVARAEYSHVDNFFNAPRSEPSEFEDIIDRLGRTLGQPNRVRNRYLAYSMDFIPVLRQPWVKLQSELAATIGRHESFDWGYLIDPFGSLLFLRTIDWQIKLVGLLRQVYISDGKLRLATLVVRINHDKVNDRDIPAFVAGVGPELYDPFSNKPMKWDSKNGRIYLITSDDGCSIAAFRVPIWDVKSGRQPPKQAEWTIC